MSDREALIALCERMGLERWEVPPGRDLGDMPLGRNYAVAGDEVWLGPGEGYVGFFAVFHFDAEGRATWHGLWE